MYTDCKQTARVLYIFWTGVKCQNLSFRPIAIAIAIAIGIAITITIANGEPIGNGDGTPRRECLWGYSSNWRTASSNNWWKP